MNEATVIPLDFWQNPVEDVILIYSERMCSIYFACWRTAGEPADFIGHLAFEHASGVRSSRREHPPYCIPPHSHHSYILEIPDSDFVREYVTRRNLRAPGSPLRLADRHHFVVVGHDIFHEVVAANFTSTTIPHDQVKDSALRTLIE